MHILVLGALLVLEANACSCSMNMFTIVNSMNGTTPECVWQWLVDVCPCAAKSQMAAAKQKVCVPIEPVPPEAAYVERVGHNLPMTAQIIYKGGLLNLKGSGFTRLIYIDLGANAYHTSIGKFLRAKYPHGTDFVVEAFEPSSKHMRTYEASGDTAVRLHQFAAWTRNETLKFMSYDNTGPYHVGKSAGRGSNKHKPKEVEVPALDIAEFIHSHVTMDDFVIVKCDIEGAEYEVVPHLLNSVAGLIDEFFAEVHYNPANPLEIVHEKTIKDARALVASLRAKGVYAHAWN